VVEDGRLCGLARRAPLAAPPPGTRVGALVEWSPALRADQPLDAVASFVTVFGADPIPVVDRAGRIVGSFVVPSRTPELDLPAPWQQPTTTQEGIPLVTG
jgi:hypothetical protein